MKRIFLPLLIAAALPMAALAQNTVPVSPMKAAGAPNNPKVEVAWNRYYDHAAITQVLQRLNRAYPDLTELVSLGKSVMGKDIWMIRITNGRTGDHLSKPGMFINANIHGNEIQAAETALYTAWYLLESYATNAWIRDLLDTKTFYIVPTQNPDSRDKFLKEPNTTNTPRSGQMPMDDDGDGQVDEDRFNDLDKDGHITQMRIRVPGGRWKISDRDPRMMVPAAAGEQGTHEVFWTEGLDMDGDGQINEDNEGAYDANRNWGWLWAPNYIQRGAHFYPFSLPETKAIRDFVLAHPNLLGGQSYHNMGGMMLRGPGVEGDRRYAGDDRVYDVIGKKGEEMLPGYRYLITYKDLYTVYGGETDWMYAGLGILPFVNELWTQWNLFRRPAAGGFGRLGEDIYRFDELLLFGDAFTPWTEVDHPTLGKVEVGGMRKYIGRIPPSFLLEEELHRNMAFTLWHAYELPVLEVSEITTKSLGGGLTEVRASIVNKRAIPTRLEVDVVNRINRPDRIRLTGGTVVTGGIRTAYADGRFTEQTHNPAELLVDAIPGNGAVHVTWIVRGNGPFTVEVESPKGGRASARK